MTHGQTNIKLCTVCTRDGMCSSTNRFNYTAFGTVHSYFVYPIFTGENCFRTGTCVL